MTTDWKLFMDGAKYRLAGQLESLRAEAPKLSDNQVFLTLQIAAAWCRIYSTCAEIVREEGET